MAKNGLGVNKQKRQEMVLMARNGKWSGRLLNGQKWSGRLLNGQKWSGSLLWGTIHVLVWE